MAKRRGVTARGTAAFIVLTMAASAAGACGEDRPEGVPAAFEELQAAFGNRDAAGVCDRVSTRAKRQVGSFGHSRPTTCERDMRRLFKWMPPQSAADADGPRVKTVEVDGDEAIATVALTGYADGRLPFVRQAGRWRLDDFLAMSAPTETGAATGVSASQGGRQGPRRCPRIGSGGLVGVTGGCQTFAGDEIARLTILTAVGPLDFARCDVQFSLYIGPDGDTRMVNFAAFGVEPNSPCGDVVACRREVADKSWHGRIEATKEGFRNVADLCLDTCMGRFEGRLALDVVRVRRAWRIRAARTVAGGSLQLDGEWRLRSSALELRG